MSNIIDSIQLSGVTYQIQGGGGGGVPESTFTAYTATTDERISQDEEVTAAGLNALNEKITPTVELTQAEYEALVTAGTVSADTYYIITDAEAGDLTNYYTKSETNTLLGGKADTATTYTKTEVDNLVTAATATKQDTLVSGTNIKTINNESILGSGNIDIQGGGTTYSAGSGISITNDTISVFKPIFVRSDINSVSIGQSAQTFGSNARLSLAVGATNNIKKSNSVAFGESNNINGQTSAAIGVYNNTNNQAELSVGKHNNSVSASATFGDSGNTLFSVGNGTSNNARHNAFEIRQNGDIYLTKDGQDVKLQDQLGGSSITVDTALDSGSTNPVENRVVYNKIDEVEQVTAAALNNINDRLSEDEEVTAAGLNAINDKFDGLKLKKLSQAAYDALSGNTDSNTLYVIVN